MRDDDDVQERRSTTGDVTPVFKQSIELTSDVSSHRPSVQLSSEDLYYETKEPSVSNDLLPEVHEPPNYKRSISTTRMELNNLDEQQSFVRNNDPSYQISQVKKKQNNTGVGTGLGGFEALSSLKTGYGSGGKTGGNNSWIGAAKLKVRKPLGNFCHAALAMVLLMVCLPLYHLKGEDSLPYLAAFGFLALINIMQDVVTYMLWYYYPAIIIKEDGLWDNNSLRGRPGFSPSRFGFGLIRWGDMHTIEIWSDARGACAIAITLKNVDEFKKRYMNTSLQEELEHVLNINDVESPTGDKSQNGFDAEQNKKEFHLSIPFGKELDVDVLFAYGRIIQFVKLDRFRAKKYKSPGSSNGGH